MEEAKSENLGPETQPKTTTTINTSIQNSSDFKRNVAYKLRIGEILSSSPVIENERLKHLESGSRKIVRVNVIGNIIDKFIQDGEKKYGSITLDDATGQIRAKVFGDELEKIEQLNQGDTILLIGLVRSWNNEIYLTPEIVKKADPAYLLIRKLESEKEAPKIISKESSIQMKDKILEMVKNAEGDGGIFLDKIIMELKESPEIINNEVKKLLENGLVYEPRPGKLRYLG